MRTSLLQRIESTEFAISIETASSEGSYVRYVDDRVEYRELLTELRAHPGDAVHLVERIQRLSNAKIDARYANPSDVALAVYLRALSVVNDGLAAFSAHIAVNTVNTWWARKVARGLLTKRANESSTTAKAIPVYLGLEPRPGILVGTGSPALQIVFSDFARDLRPAMTGISTLAISGVSPARELHTEQPRPFAVDTRSAAA